MNQIGKSARKLKSALLVTAGGIGAYGLICFYKNNESFYRNYIMPTIHMLDPETSHNLAIFASKYRLLSKSKFKDSATLNVCMFGKRFSNPIGIAAGFDKNGEAVLGLQDMGFGFIEIGSVTPEPQPGNEKPRVFRLNEDNAVINRYGFNSHGHDIVHERLQKLREKTDYNGILGINLGKNKESTDANQDYRRGIEKFSNIADYYVINVSSPNTPGLRQMQSKRELEQLLTIVIKARNDCCGATTPRTPILLKLAPDLTVQEKTDIATVINKPDCKVDGIIVCNTTTARPSHLINLHKAEAGGLSGNPLKAVSTRMIADMYVLTDGQCPIVGVGGVRSGADAYEKIRAGASVVQIYTALVYEGPPVVAKVKRELQELLVRDGFENVQKAVGIDAKKVASV